MLAPLKDRSVLEREPTGKLAASDTELIALRLALREARRVQRRSATISARKIVELTNEVNRLNDYNMRLRRRLEELESGQTLITLGQQLMALREENARMAEAAQRLWFLDRTLCAAHRECERLATERDAALECLNELDCASKRFTALDK